MTTTLEILVDSESVVEVVESGPSGPAGADSTVPGPQGEDGTDGTDGIDGQDGQDGEDGQDGQDGEDGQDGQDGQDGEDGEDGEDALSEVLDYVDILGALGEGVSPSWDKSTFNAAIAAQACTVTIVGTSIAVGTAEAENSNTWTNKLKEYIQYKYPDVVFTFNNLALGGRSIVNYNNSGYVGSSDPAVDSSVGYYVEANPDTWPAGSTVGQSWKDAAQATAPDLFIMAHGQNDRAYAYTYQSYLNTAINDALSWTKAPSIALVSELLPRSNVVGFDRISDIANYLRWYAMYNSYGLIDVNRAWRAVRQNIDCFRTVAQRQDSVAGWTQSGATATLTADSLTNTSSTNAFITKVGDYGGLRLSFDFTPTTNQADWEIAANIVSTGDTDNGCVWIQRSGSLIKIKKRPIAGNEQSFAIVAPVAGTVEKWDVRVKRGAIQIHLNGLFVGSFFHKQTSGSGSVQFGLNTGSATNIVCDLENQPRVFAEDVATDDELLGITQGAWQSGDYTVGGNSINHPSRLGLSRVFDVVIRQFVNELPLLDYKSSVASSSSVVPVMLNCLARSPLSIPSNQGWTGLHKVAYSTPVVGGTPSWFTLSSDGFSITLSEDGVYELSHNTFVETTLGERSSPSARFSIGGVLQAIRPATGYIRASADHFESSTHIANYLVERSGSDLVLTVPLGNESFPIATNASMLAGESTLTIKKIT